MKKINKTLLTTLTALIVVFFCVFLSACVPGEPMAAVDLVSEVSAALYEKEIDNDGNESYIVGEEKVIMTSMEKDMLEGEYAYLVFDFKRSARSKTLKTLIFTFEVEKDITLPLLFTTESGVELLRETIELKAGEANDQYFSITYDLRDGDAMLLKNETLVADADNAYFSTKWKITSFQFTVE